MKDLSTPTIDAARERQRKFGEMIETLSPLKWYQWKYWSFAWWRWRHGL
jgi:hypothetical protein